MTTREKARAQTTKVYQIYKVYQQNKAAGIRHPIEYLRYMILQKRYRDELWLEAEKAK